MSDLVTVDDIILHKIISDPAIRQSLPCLHSARSLRAYPDCRKCAAHRNQAESAKQCIRSMGSDTARLISKKLNTTRIRIFVNEGRGLTAFTIKLVP